MCVSRTSISMILYHKTMHFCRFSLVGYLRKSRLRDKGTTMKKTIMTKQNTFFDTIRRSVYSTQCEEIKISAPLK